MTSERSLVVYLFLICLILSQIRFANGIQEIQETYEWECKSIYGIGTTHSLTLTTPAIWRVDTETNITFRFELTSKGPGYNFTDPVYLLIKVQAGRERARQLESKNYAYDTFLRAARDCWEENITFSVPAELLPRGETAVSWITFELVYNHRYLNRVQGSQEWEKSVMYYDPTGGLELGMDFEIHRPLLSTTETFAAGGLGTATVFVLLVLGLYKSGQLALCGWGVHNWRGSGDSVIIRWKEVRVIDNPSHLNTVSKSRKEDVIKSERKCRYCGLHQKRKFTMNEVGELVVAGWETVDS